MVASNRFAIPILDFKFFSELEMVVVCLSFIIARNNDFSGTVHLKLEVFTPRKIVNIITLILSSIVGRIFQLLKNHEELEACSVS
jgi:hypothetical protein